ncbi:MAG: InlB B-repeat-containing protein [Candidatus Cloacimonetes bacterium]|nr:InlB B-repeat-containing protein [Candidatus Cloacimonadota bacterium]
MKKVLLMILVVLSLTVTGITSYADNLQTDGQTNIQVYDHNSNLVQTVYNWNGTTNPGINAPSIRYGYMFTGYRDDWNNFYSINDSDWYLDLAANNQQEDPYIELNYEWTYVGYLTVNYYDWDNTLLDTEQVLYMDEANPPANPTRTGYVFLYWSYYQDLDSVTSNINTTAIYQVASYTVTFKDWNGNTLKTQTVSYDTDATPPANPTRTGYTFSGWLGNYENVRQNETVTALYTINTYTVTFKDWDDSVLKTETVNYLANATPPANPTRSGYEFIGWTGGFYTYVTENRTLTASYLQQFTLTFELAGGLPQYDDYIFTDGDVLPLQNYTPTRDGYVFVKWLVNWDDVAFTDGDLVANDLKLSNGTVTAVWDVSGTTIQNAYDNGKAQGLVEGELIGWQEAFEYFYANGFDGYQEGYVNDGSYAYEKGYTQGTTDSIDNSNAIERFIPGILGVLFGFFFQLASISVMGISVLDVLVLLFALGVVLLIIKIFTGK